MSRSTKSFIISLALLAVYSLTACSDDDVYQAPEAVDTYVLAVGDNYGDAMTGWNVTDIPNGIYDLEFYTKSSQTTELPYLAASGKMTAIKPSEKTWAKNVIKGIEVSNGTCRIELGNGEGIEIADLQLVSSRQAEFNLVKGGDISLLSYVEDNGGKYYNADGQSDDCLEILKQNGMNLVRLRLYNDPGNKDFYPSNTLPAGYQNQADILNLAKRAKEKGMEILLTFHYSDYWTNGDDQYKPHEWADLDFETLKTAVHDYTADFLRKMSAQGTTPEYVAIGNEIQAGLLYPDGACDDPIKMCALLNAGAKAVREVAPDARIVIHSTYSEGIPETTHKWFYGLMRDYAVDYDIIGISYYPFWTNMWASDFRAWADRMVNLFNKDILVVETGYAWNRTLPDGNPGQLSHNGPYAEFSKLGQRDFIADLTNQIKQVKSGRVLGYIYWDPIFIEIPGLGWILGDKNYVSNTTLFGFQGELLPVFDAIKYNN
ncbi:glycoside hydrolase family 53 protein [Bacteroides clarus]|uniref:glycoside hydrolase family 53 protein n=1 Tax=Bacteroides clarus TaxID=626929 RepID=UPI0026757E35|nr:glycosyl hydrolase 53 family protein [Bacteroides clarus]